MIKAKIEQPPVTSLDLLKRAAYLEETKLIPLSRLRSRIDLFKRHLIELACVVSYTEIDLIQAAIVFAGPDQIVPMLETGSEVE